MSDIAIRFDGLVVGAVLLGGVLIFTLISGAAMIRTLIAKPSGSRSWRIVYRSACLAFAHVAAFVAVIIYLSEVGASSSGPDWLDWLALPCSIFTLSGLVLIFRSRTVTATNQPAGREGRASP